MKILIVGEVMAEIRGDEQTGFSIGLAGDTYNTAVYCARLLGEAGSVGYMTRIGLDPFSATVINNLKLEGIADDKVGKDEENNLGIYSVTTDDVGERSFHYWRNQSAARGLFSNQSDLEKLAGPKIIYLSAITLAILSNSARQDLVRRLKELADQTGTLIAFDSNYRPKLWANADEARAAISELWELAHIALPSIDDEMALYEETAEQVVARFSKGDWTACAIKRGPEGPLSPALGAENHPAFQPAEKVVDTTAAGDSFNAGYLSGFIMQKSEADCLSMGHETARRVVQIPGAIAPIQDF